MRLEKPFEQRAGNIYWLDVSARPIPGGNFVWGWETSKDHWNDAAVLGNGTRWEALGGYGSDFDDLILGTIYLVGQPIDTHGLRFIGSPFQWSNGVWTSGGRATVVALGRAGGSGKEIAVNNINLELDIGPPLAGLSLLFGEYGGNLNLRINGDFRNFNNFADINGATIGGVRVTVVNGFGNDKGILRLEGMVDEFSVGGQELFVDDLKPGPFDMAFLLMTPDDEKYCEGDFDRDGDVDGSDLARFAADYGRTDCYNSGDCEGDFDYDGDVDGSDLARFAADYGRTDCPCRLPKP